MTFARRRYGRDNYLYLLAVGGDAALVDPGDADAALALVGEQAVRPRWVLHTHGHPDHTGGSDRLRKELGVTVLGHEADAERFRPDVFVEAGADLELGTLRIHVHPAPGHTPGSVLYEWSGRLLTGDTLFWGGCGNCRHGGDVGRLAETFLGVFSSLDPSLEIHPGHDYAEANLPFVLALEPSNRAAAGRYAAVRAARAGGIEPEATDLGEERLVNPFLRAGTNGVREALEGLGRSAGSAREAFAALRALRDDWSTGRSP
ncbi:MAG TPA: MBL fold metallo-hydrolase [Anaeromyxobacteraceae bacterium]|nr:MBL fold metallo-hydrolase [Anaeromyxobacteraceae bacterium]